MLMFGLFFVLYFVKFTKLANMITLKRSFIVQSQKLVIVYTRPHVRIVSSYFNNNYKIKQNTTIMSIAAKNIGLSYILLYR